MQHQRPSEDVTPSTPFVVPYGEYKDPIELRDDLNRELSGQIESGHFSIDQLIDFLYDMQTYDEVRKAANSGTAVEKTIARTIVELVDSHEEKNEARTAYADLKTLYLMSDKAKEEKRNSMNPPEHNATQATTTRKTLLQWLRKIYE